MECNVISWVKLESSVFISRLKYIRYLCPSIFASTLIQSEFIDEDNSADTKPILVFPELHSTEAMTQGDYHEVWRQSKKYRSRCGQHLSDGLANKVFKILLSSTGLFTRPGFCQSNHWLGGIIWNNRSFL